MEYSLNDLFNFVEISNCRTLSEGARKLQISQSALSESIKRIEEQIGLVVFFRSRNGIQLTEEGRILLKRAKNLQQNYWEIAHLKKQQEMSKLQIRIGAHATVAQYLFPKAFQNLKKTIPELQLELVHDLSRVIQEKVQKGEIDFAIVINPIRVPDLVVKELAKDRVGVFASRAFKKSVTDELTFICHPDLYQSQTLLKKIKATPSHLISTSSLELVARLTEAGIGLGIIPEKVAQMISSDLVLREEFPVLKDEIAMIYRPEFVRHRFYKEIIRCFEMVF